MGAAPGLTVLDAGCGPGEDTIGLASVVGPRGRVVGVDFDESLLRVARARVKELGLRNVEHRRAQLPRLPFRANTFDAVRSERVFQHLEQPFESLQALVRVTKPGGRVVLMEPDWGTLVIDAGDTKLERKVLQAGCDFAMNNATAGRRLIGMFVRAGLGELTAQISPLQYADLAAADHYILSGFEEAALPKVGARVMKQWRAALELAQHERRFFATFNCVIACGTKLR